jgi:putative ABC transport system permease protein
VALLICTGVVYQQLQYTQAKDLGFEGEQVVVAEVPRGQGDAFRERVLGDASVVSASLAESVPGQFSLTMNAEAGQVTPGANVEDDTAIRFRPAVADTNYVETLGLEIIAGRDVDPQRASDRQEAHLLNETAAEALGWTPEGAVGQPFSLNGDPGRVVGVVRDFHTASLREPIQPVVIQFSPLGRMSAGKKLAVRFAGGSVAAGMEHLRAQWKQFTADSFEYAFLDERFAAMYEAERRLGRVFALFAGIAIAVACLGLFGLAAYAAERRRKEIAIRKVLGATARSVVALLSTDFLRLVALALVVAAPAAYVLMQRWLEDFAYRIDIGPGVFVLAIVATLAVALATVSAQALRAAWTDPATAIRQE